MRLPFLGILLVSLLASCAGGPGRDPLFVNLTAPTSDHRTEMALAFALSVAKKGHPVTVFCNDQAVKTVAKSNPEGAAAREAIAKLFAEKATVIACPMCMKHFLVSSADLVEGVQVGNPDLTQGKLFAKGARTLSW